MNAPGASHLGQPPVDLPAYSDTVEYELRDAAYAAEFAELN
jgi:hypothetical protein